MKTTNIEISTDILNWIIETINPEILSSEVGQQLISWRDGEKQPTYNQIEKASKATGIPLGYFFLKKPPVEDTKFVEYRTIDSVELSNPSRNLMDTMHDMELVQDWAKNELKADGNDEISFIGKVSKRSNVGQFAKYVREILGLDERWFEQSRTVDDSFRYLRNKISTVGVLVMMSGIVGNNTHRPLDTNEFRAFALVDNIAPLIFINANDSMNGKLFSLLHEFAHLCIGESSLFNDRDGSAAKVSSEEQLCNALAAEILIPQNAFLNEWENNIGELDEEETIEELTKIFKCGSTVVARKALDQGFISQATYQKIAKQAVYFYLQNKKKGSGGGDFYRTAASRIDRRFFYLLLGSVHEGRTLYSDAFRLTNTNRSTFANLAERMGGVV